MSTVYVSSTDPIGCQGTPCYSTIQDAVDASATDGTIFVAPGNYAENVSINVTGLKLFGAQYLVDARQRFPPSLAAESVVTAPSLSIDLPIFQVEAKGVVIAGFVLQQNSPPGGSPKSSNQSAIGSVAFPAPPGVPNDLTGLVVMNNIIRNNFSGVTIISKEPMLASPMVKYTFTQNVFQHNNGNPDIFTGGQGIFFTGGSGVLITNNNFLGDETSAAINLNGINAGPSTVQYVEVSNNVLVNDGSMSIVAVLHILIANNAIYATVGSGILLAGANSDVLISGNCITNDQANAINIRPIFSPLPNSDVTIVNNNIMGSTLAGIRLRVGGYTPGGTLPAINNYWGSPTGPNYNGTGVPGNGDLIINDDLKVTIQFVPFLTAPSPLAVCSSTVNITTQTSATSYSVGALVVDTATLSFGNNPTGALTFRAYGPFPLGTVATCSGSNIVSTTVVPVISGNGSYSTSFVGTIPGNYIFQVTYSGDANNPPFTAPCDEPFTITKRIVAIEIFHQLARRRQCHKRRKKCTKEQNKLKKVKFIFALKNSFALTSIGENLLIIVDEICHEKLHDKKTIIQKIIPLSTTTGVPSASQKFSLDVSTKSYRIQAFYSGDQNHLPTSNFMIL